LLGAGFLTGAGQIILYRLTGGNGVNITETISRFAGRLPARRTLGSAVLSVLLVGMGAPLGREGAPKQAGAVIANALSDRARLSDEQRKLLVACGAGAGMAAAYGVPLGGCRTNVDAALDLLVRATLCDASLFHSPRVQRSNYPSSLPPLVPLFGRAPSPLGYCSRKRPLAQPQVPPIQQERRIGIRAYPESNFACSPSCSPRKRS
jgi:hypothetical protein